MKKIESSKRSVDELFSFLNIIRISLNEKTFRDWLQHYHKVKNDKRYLAGYRFFLETCMRCLTSAIELDEAMGLVEDDVFERTHFVELKLSDIPNTCEKTIFIKNLWKHMKRVRKLKNWAEVDQLADDMMPFFQIFDKIYEDYVTPLRKDLGKDEILNISTMANVYLHLNNTSRGFPLGYILVNTMEHRGSIWSSTNLDKDERYFSSVFTGYVHSLEYLWFRLLGEERFQASCTSSIHRTDRNHSSNEPRSRERKSRQEGRRKWRALDIYFEQIRNEIILPLEKEKQLDITEPLLILAENFRKQAIQSLLDPRELEDPSYLSGQDKESIKKKLAYEFLWYPINALDAEVGYIFNGGEALISVLVGLVERLKYLREPGEVLVREFQHPTEDPDNHDYSYAVLIPISSNIGSDYSGWLVFFNCAYDSSSGVALFEEINELIGEYRSEHLLKIERLTVDKEIFKEYLSEKNVSSGLSAIGSRIGGTYRRLTYSAWEKVIRAQMDEARGKLFEYLFYAWLTKERGKDYSNIRCDISVNGRQIDVSAEDKSGSTCIFECKVALHEDTLDETMDQVQGNKVAVEREYSGRNVIPCLVVYAPIRGDHQTKITHKGIEFVSNFKRRIDMWRELNSDSRKKIFGILR